MNGRGAGWGHGLLGVAIFSGSLPATRLAVADLPPLALTSGRAVAAAVLAGLCLAAFQGRRPARADLPALAATSLGVVLGFPLLTAYALEQMTAARSIVFVGLLPLATAVFSVLRGGPRPKPPFWAFSLLGAALVMGFALAEGGGGAGAGDPLMLAAILLCGLGYAEGAKLSRDLGGWRTISWALLLAAPIMVGILLASWPEDWSGVRPAAWLGFGYVSIFSMFVGFVFWYRGLALGGAAGVGQLQLLQPFLGLGLAGLVLGEPVAPSMLAAALCVALCVVGARRFT